MVSLQQRTPEWHTARNGKLTASNIGAVLGLCPWTSRLQAFNRATGVDRFIGKQFNDALGRMPQLDIFLRIVCGTGNEACLWGTRNEANGILAYTAHTGNVVKSTGLHIHPYIPWLAGSPDGLIGTDGLLEVKCPFPFKRGGATVHMHIPEHYYMQIILCLEVSDREWCDFISWLPSTYRVYRVTRDHDLHEAMMPYYTAFFAAMERKAAAPPLLSDKDKEAIKTAVCASMAQHIDYQFWDRVNLETAPPSPDPLSDEDEPDAKRLCQ